MATVFTFYGLYHAGPGEWVMGAVCRLYPDMVEYVLIGVA